MITKSKGISFHYLFLVSWCTRIGKNDFLDIIGNNAYHGNISVVHNKVEKLEKFVGLNLDSPFDVYEHIFH